MTAVIAILVVAAVAIVGVYVSWRAGRLDRLHSRLDAARFALDAALVRRSSIALELASSGLLDPATSMLLAGAAHDARSASHASVLCWPAGRAPTNCSPNSRAPRTRCSLPASSTTTRWPLPGSPGGA